MAGSKEDMTGGQGREERYEEETHPLPSRLFMLFLQEREEGGGVSPLFKNDQEAKPALPPHACRFTCLCLLCKIASFSFMLCAYIFIGIELQMQPSTQREGGETGGSPFPSFYHAFTFFSIEGGGREVGERRDGSSQHFLFAAPATESPQKFSNAVQQQQSLNQERWGRGISCAFLQRQVRDASLPFLSCYHLFLSKSFHHHCRHSHL